MEDELVDAVAAVVQSDNCCGCGACTLLDPRLVMEVDDAGYNRPVVREDIGREQPVAAMADARADFEAICPGLGVNAGSDPSAQRDPWFGPVVSTWRAHAIDPAHRHLGSSGGVLTALSAWLLASGQATEVVAAGADPDKPMRSTSVTLRSPREADSSAGSRYAPVSSAANPSVLTEGSAIVAKPCEVSALRSLHRQRDVVDPPLLMSFFCAGVPSQTASEELVTSLGGVVDEVIQLRYRGMGWPGRFTARHDDSREVSCSYQESWGEVLGRSIQWRCKICVDGVGENADLAAGDMWSVDDRGYPVFEEAEGQSVVIARTQRGHEMLASAVAAGVVGAVPVEIERLRPVQPFQVERRRTLLGRLIGTRLAGRSIPAYRGFALTGLALRAPIRNLRSAVGSFLRVRQLRASMRASSRRRRLVRDER